MRDHWAFLDLDNNELPPEEREIRLKYKKSMEFAYNNGIAVSVICAGFSLLINLFLYKYISPSQILSSKFLMLVWPFNERILTGYSATDFSHSPQFYNEMAAYLLSNDVINVVFMGWTVVIALYAHFKPTYFRLKVGNLKFISVYVFILILGLTVFYLSPSDSKNVLFPSYHISPWISALKESYVMILFYLILTGLLPAVFNNIRVLRSDPEAS